MKKFRLGILFSLTISTAIQLSACYDLEPDQKHNWHKGNLHSHSVYSDGDSSVNDNVETAENKGFDFFALTDHNTNSHWYDVNYYSNQLTLLNGVEWTTKSGHANIWSNEQFEWELFQSTITGKGDAKTAIAMAHSLRVLVDLYYTMGIPTTYVFAESNYGKDILAGIRAGHVFITHSPNGPQMHLKANIKNNEEDEYHIIMGDSIPSDTLDNDVKFRINVYGARTAKNFVGYSHLLIIKNGKRFKMKVFSNEDYVYEFTDKPEKNDYYRAELRMVTFDHNKKLEEYVQIDNVVTITNAIYTW